MSSAAVQQTGPTISSRSQYQQPPHGRDQYYQQQPAPAQSSPTQQRNKSARPSGNGEPSTPQQSQHYSPSASNTSDMTTPRAQPASSSTQPSPVIASSPYNAHTGPVPPPRTSSNHRTSAQPVQDPYQSQRSTDERPPSSRTASQNMREDPASAAANAAQRRRQPSREQQNYQSSTSSSRTKQTPTHSRSATAVGTPPMGSSLPREESTVINRLVIADPQEDIAREQARMAEGRGADITPITGLGLVGNEGVDDGGRGAGKSRQDHSREKPRRETKFGDYILGQTLGEGEFGKVKMGWKKDGGVQVAIKLIRREVLGSNPSRLPKIYREISILRGLQHPNIVRLHEMVETERHIGIILEYASGGELFDYILNHRYLKDNSARRLFAQLVSGVGYLHKKGIVHRDLKLENLLLDRNKNIIITDFGFANTFDPNDELGDEIEYNLGNKDFVKKTGLEIVGESGHRRGDLMQTSCGSPCYAAPELVVSDSLYTGRKVDVWSCGVILYAMLAGYLPFDDDPANPEGDNINLLYKYIVSTPLTFPEYVTPHARDLLKRILVPDPRKRADLFEVARHSWLSEYAHVVGFITSSTTTSSDIANTTVPPEDPYEVPQLARSASVREASKQHTSVAAVGGLTQKHGHIDQNETPEKQGRRDAKRRTPKGKQYVISAPMPQEQDPSGTMGQPSTQRMPSGGYQQQQQAEAQPHSQRNNSHKRSNTVGGIGEKIFRTSLFGGSSGSKPQKSYPPVSMNNSITSGDSAGNRKSTESGPTSAPADQTQFQARPAYQYEDNTMQQYPSNSEQSNAYYHNNESDLSSQGPQSLPYRSRNAPYDSAEAVSEPREGRARVLQKNRRFADAYEDQQRHAGSSGAARRVMDLFRRRGKARGG
ncbi:putative serine threonine protein kinase protein [Neofusicoccum parvum UCRNP2]|uniref:non-specific serine/threonine protein kinase n=1 Tax=Botryosphaeria parva (strain UCR-NP2) TaxID=1287680 RepID=R1EXS5_BOTPV|nr:putative serine threonine protein kinase protein [Neofusicoccum parvum UCRNP2]